MSLPSSVVIGALETRIDLPTLDGQRLLVLQIRRLGDAVISTALIESLAATFPGLKIEVLAHVSMKRVYQFNPHVSKLHVSEFPVGLSRMGIWAPFRLLRLLRKCIELRLSSFDLCVNTVGDLREIAIGRIVSRGRNVSVKWLPEHPFFKQVKSGLFGLVDDAVAIPTTVLNIYDAIAFFGRSLGCSMNKRPKLYDLDGEPISAMPEQSVVGIHPFSSDSWRTWPAGLWARLVSELRNRLIKVRLFAASSEESKLQEIFGELVDNNWVTIDVGGIGSFFEALRRVTVLIGMDSFAVHSAYAIGIPTVMLNGSNDFRVWCPPNSRVINGGPACVYYPCFNRPRCRGSSSEFICFSSITVEQVLGAVEPFLRPE